MRTFIGKRIVVIFMPLLLLLSLPSCPAVGAVAVKMVTQVVTVVGREAGRIAIAEAVRYGMDAVFTAIFSDTADKSSSTYSTSVIPLKGRPGFGKLKYDGEFAVKSEINGYDLGINTIKIPGEYIIFKRTQFGTWELTQDSRTMIKERVEIATAQQVLRGMDYNPGRVDGVVGPRTNSAVAKFQKDYPQYFGNNPSKKLDYNTRQSLLTYQTTQ